MAYPLQCKCTGRRDAVTARLQRIYETSPPFYPHQHVQQSCNDESERGCCNDTCCNVQPLGSDGVRKILQHSALANNMNFSGIIVYSFLLINFFGDGGFQSSQSPVNRRNATGQYYQSGKTMSRYIFCVLMCLDAVVSFKLQEELLINKLHAPFCPTIRRNNRRIK